MEVKFTAEDTVRIPDGCKAIIENGMVIFKKEESKEQEFKRGDVIVSKANEILIVDVHSFENRILRSFVNIKEDGTLFNSSYSSWNEHHAWRLASEEEKQKLFTKMKEQGLQWNAEEKRVEKTRWRAEKGEKYFTLKGATLVVDFYTEDFDRTDEKCHEYGNYFRTEEQTEEARKRVEETLRKYHEEIGE